MSLKELTTPERLCRVDIIIAKRRKRHKRHMLYAEPGCVEDGKVSLEVVRCAGLSPRGRLGLGAHLNRNLLGISFATPSGRIGDRQRKVFSVYKPKRRVEPQYM